MTGIWSESPTEIIIHVKDINDNFPQFTQPEFKCFVEEGSSPDLKFLPFTQGTTVGAVSAVDQDDPATPNGIIKYKIVYQRPKVPHDKMFTVDSESGMISTVRLGIDREQVSQYELLMEARDLEGYPNGRASTATVVVTVTDINDNLPKFGENEYRGEGRENVVGIVVAIVGVNDRDERHSPAWRAVYTVVEGDPENRFLVKTNSTSNEGMVTVVKPLDFEAGEARFVVQVENESPVLQEGSQLPSTATVIIKVIDVNEPPVFEHSPHRANVSEDVSVGSHVTIMKAHDPDVFRKQIVRYVMWHDPLQWLSIDPLSGAVKTRAPLDREHEHLVEGVYEVLVKARDTSVPSATTTGTLHLKLNDMNDHTPVMSHKEVSICQGEFITLSATDEDIPPNTTPFIFKLFQEPDIQEKWTIEARSGDTSILIPKKDLPDGTYSLSFEISDSGTPALTGYSSMNVSVSWCDIAGKVAGNDMREMIVIVTLPVLIFALHVFILWMYLRRRKVNQRIVINPSRNDDLMMDHVFRWTSSDEQGEEKDQEEVAGVVGGIFSMQHNKMSISWPFVSTQQEVMFQVVTEEEVITLNLP
uniref:cadherin-2A-like n=1 Tax=Myxine glutinosa TaxID=7769 RepID=UPI00358E04F3